MENKSIGTAVFVRDDAADPRGNSGMFAYYKLQSVTYTATETGTIGACTNSASETVMFSNPSPVHNLVSVHKQPDSQGRYEYDVTTTLTTPRPGALTITCNPGGTSTALFNAELNVAAGVPAPTTTDVNSLKATVNNFGVTWAWDLKGVN